MGQVGLEPTTALSTGFTVRGDTNYIVPTHMVSVEGVEPSILPASGLKPDVYASSTTRPYKWRIGDRTPLLDLFIAR